MQYRALRKKHPDRHIVFCVQKKKELEKEFDEQYK